MKDIVIFNFLGIIVSFVRAQGWKPRFQLETVKRVSYARGSLANMNPHEHYKLCKAAKNFALLEGMEPNSLFYIFDHEIEFSDGRKEIHSSLRCPTVPVVYLRRGSAPDELNIVFEDNKFLDKRFTFRSEIVKSVSRTVPKSSLLWNYEIDNHDAYNMCVAAKDRIPHLIKTQDLWTEIRTQNNYMYEYYEFVYNGKREKDAAIKCPTYPPTYLRVKNGGNEIDVMIVYDGQ